MLSMPTQKKGLLDGKKGRIYGRDKLLVPQKWYLMYLPDFVQTVLDSSEILDTYHKFLQHRYKNLQAVVRKATGNSSSNLHTVPAN